MTPAAGSGGREVGAPVGATPPLGEADAAALWARAAAVGLCDCDELRRLGFDLVEGERRGGRVTGDDGREYIDCVAGLGIFNLGRRPEEVLAALRGAVSVSDQGNFPLMSVEKAEFARRLAMFVPGDLDRVVLSAGRGEAFDVACKLARAHTGRGGLVSVEGGWYGDTGFALSLSDRPDRDDAGPLIPGTGLVPFGDLGAVDEALDASVAAFVLEPVQAECGCRVADGAYLRAVAKLCRERGVLLILDETQTGMGRTGWRFACEHWGVVPDMLIVGESVAAGVFPLCATLLPQRLAGFLDDHPLIHLSTFGGSDVGCRVGLRALEVYLRDEPWKNARTAGRALRSALEEVAARRPDAVRGIDGLGLLLAIRLADEESAATFCRALAGQGVLVLPGAVAADTVVLRPPLTLSASTVERIAAACAAAAEMVRPSGDGMAVGPARGRRGRRSPS